MDPTSKTVYTDLKEENPDEHDLTNTRSMKARGSQTKPTKLMISKIQYPVKLPIRQDTKNTF